MNKFDNFTVAFDTHTGSCSAQCACGKQFYNSDGAWDFEEGELDKLQNDSDATDLLYSVSFVQFEGSLYVFDCTCWRDRAKRIMEFIDGHAFQIIEYLKLEKTRKAKEAEESPVLDKI